MKPKFRAWDTLSKIMYYHGNLENGDAMVLNIEGGIQFSSDDTYRQKDFKLMQYTGLKDKNGKEVYEGDVVTTTYGKYDLEPNGLTRFGTVIYDVKTARFAISIKNSAVLVSFYDVNKIEVTGNIYETPAEVTP